MAVLFSLLRATRGRACFSLKAAGRQHRSFSPQLPELYVTLPRRRFRRRSRELLAPEAEGDAPSALLVPVRLLPSSQARACPQGPCLRRGPPSPPGGQKRRWRQNIGVNRQETMMRYSSCSTVRGPVSPPHPMPHPMRPLYSSAGGSHTLAKHLLAACRTLAKDVLCVSP
ncbi:unnamed protein product [Prorocentrum cordatum]|uniref:Uncharacterized protein n=1 Tax=Prorocentrum cordatum TaxID=2364126 RepID=A0ABN9T2E6_9DINO|nr:unnamed protein product [Polarella glacialis]